MALSPDGSAAARRSAVREWLGGLDAGRYLADETSLVFISAPPAVAYKVNEWLSVGAAFHIIPASIGIRTLVGGTDSSLGGTIEMQSKHDGNAYSSVMDRVDANFRKNRQLYARNRPNGTGDDWRRREREATP